MRKRNIVIIAGAFTVVFIVIVVLFLLKDSLLDDLHIFVDLFRKVKR